MSEKPTIIIGIDFGTTHSGVAWALKGSPDTLEVNCTWPGGGNRTSEKVPSTICYEDSIAWGFETPYSGDVIRAMKLLLDEGQGRSYPPAFEARRILEKLGKDAVDVVGEYLGFLVAHTNELLDRRFGGTLESMDLEYFLTVPAVWSDKAKHSTLQAAIAAGIPSGSVTLVSEPEAAAIYSLHIMKDSVKRDDVILVCDAGGGTVDLISYHVKFLKRLVLEEAAEGIGAVCGSKVLDSKFDELLQAIFGLSSYRMLPTSSRKHAMRFWEEHVKVNYVGDKEKGNVGYSIPFPGANERPEIRLEGGFLELDDKHIRAVFDPVVQQVQDLIIYQLGRLAASGHTVKAILLVGGFGSSEYLFRHLKDKNKAITIIQPPNAWSAAVRGAVQYGLDRRQIKSRISRRHYGVQYHEKYRPGYHSIEDRRWNTLLHMSTVKNRMQWCLKKGQSLTRTKRYRHLLRRWVHASDTFIFEDILYFCNEDDAPDTKTPNILPLCTVRTDLSSVPRRLFEQWRNPKGEVFYKVCLYMVLTLTSGGIVVEFEFNGAPCGSVETEY